MLKRNGLFLSFICLFVLSFMLTTFTTNAAVLSTKFCSSSVGSTWNICANTQYVNDKYAYFYNSSNDNYDVPDAYHIYFNSANMTSSVTRGSPVYRYYFIYDNFNGKSKQYGDVYGTYLSDSTGVGFGTSYRTSYYPQSYGSPTTNLFVSNMPFFSCSVLTPCTDYVNANQISVK